MPSSEIQTDSIVKHAFEAGKQIYIPYIYKRTGSDGDSPASIMDMLRLDDLEDYRSLAPDRWGIPSLDKNSINSRNNCFGDMGLSQGKTEASTGAGLDLVIMPAVAFDHEMNRLGHGKGYYDNFLTRFIRAFAGSNPPGRKPFLGNAFLVVVRDTPKLMLFAVGYALREQILPFGYRLPVEPWDHPVDMLICGDQIIPPNKP